MAIRTTKTTVFVILLITAGCSFLGFYGYRIVSRHFDSELRKFVQIKTHMDWPDGTDDIRLFPRSWFAGRARWTDVFLVLPKTSLDNILQSGFRPYNPLYARGSWECGQDGLNMQIWNEQDAVFGNPPQALRHFHAKNKVLDKEIVLGPHIFYISGNQTGCNSYSIVIDSQNGNTLIHLNAPD